MFEIHKPKEEKEASRTSYSKKCWCHWEERVDSCWTRAIKTGLEPSSFSFVVGRNLSTFTGWGKEPGEKLDYAGEKKRKICQVLRGEGRGRGWCQMEELHHEKWQLIFIIEIQFHCDSFFFSYRGTSVPRSIWLGLFLGKNHFAEVKFSKGTKKLDILDIKVFGGI